MHTPFTCPCPQWVDTLFHLSGVPWCVTDHWRHVVVAVFVVVISIVAVAAGILDLVDEGRPRP